jgi:Raf kinase inhibitor-like YbhB/YbcL family protein
MPLKLKSASFENGGTIPKRFTCDGADLSPALEWSGAPANTKSFALIVDDPDAPVGTWVHWVLWNLPASAHGLPEGVPKRAELEGGAAQGQNDFRKNGYGGPCPPPGNPHRYFFKLYAVDGALKLTANGTKADLERAMQGHILAQAEWMGRYGR